MEGEAALPRTTWRAARPLLWTTALAGAISVLVSTMALPGRSGLLVGDTLQFVAALTAAVACLGQARRQTGRLRLGWALLGTGALFWTLGQLAWSWYELALGVEVPLPGLNDVFYLTLYPFAFAGLLFLSPLADRTGIVRTGLVLDGLLSVLAVFALAWPTLLDPAFDRIADPAAACVTIAYPLADILLLGVTGGILMRNLAAWRSSLGVAYVGFVGLLFADLGWSTGIFEGTYATGALADAGWIVGFFLLASASRAPHPVERTAHRGYSELVGHFVPLTSVIVGVAGFLLAREREATLDGVWPFTMALLVGLALARQALFSREAEALRTESESAQRMYHDIVENATEGIFRTTQAGDIVMANPEFARMTGYDSPDHMRREIADITHIYADPDDRAAMLAEAKATGHVVGREVRIRRRDGKLRWVSINLQPSRGRPGEFEAFVRDITDTHQMAHELRRTRRTLFVISQFNEALVRAGDETVLLQSVTDLLVKEGSYRLAWIGFAKDDAAHSVVPVAQSGFEVDYVAKVRASWSPEDPRGRGPTGRAIREAKTQVAQDILMDPTMAPWRADAVARGYASSCSLLIDLAPYGRGALMVYAAEPWAFAADEVTLLEELAGDLAFGVVSLRNRKAKVAADEARETAQADYKALFDNMTEGFAHCRMIYDQGVAVDWEYVRVNQNFEGLTGLKGAVGRRVTELVPGIRLTNQDLFKAYTRVLDAGTRERVETHVPGLDRWFAVSAYRCAPDEFIAVFDDITQRKKAEATILANEARLQEAQRLAHLGSWELDIPTNTLWWSDENYRIFGVEPGGFGATYDFFLRTIHPDDRDTVNRAYTESVATRTPYTIEHRLLMPDGKVKWVHERCETFYDGAGKPLRSVGTTQDITQRREAEAMRAQLEKQRLETATTLAAIVKASLDCIITMDAEGRVLEFNPAAEALFGYTRNEAVGSILADLIVPPARRGEHTAGVRRVLNKGEPHILNRRVEVEATRKDGSLVPVELTVIPLQSEAGPLFAGFIRDVTAEHGAREAANRLTAIVDASQEALFGIDLEGHVLSWNHGAELTFGFAASEAIGRNVEQLVVPPEGLDECHEMLQQLRRGEPIPRSELSRLCKDGRRIEVSMAVNPILDAHGRVSGGSVSAHDVTQLKQAAADRERIAQQEREVHRLQELNRMRIDFLNTAAHDLKTPLTPLKIQMATLRVRGTMDESQTHSLDMMERNVNRFQTLIDDMLDAARLQSGRLVLRRKPTPLGPLVDEAAASYLEVAQQANLILTVERLPDVRADIDPAKAMQVLMNLVSNAVKYTPAGGKVRIRIDVVQDQAVVSVQDSGLGLSAEQIARLFQPFVRLHEDQPGVAKGTGLGLYISKGIVEQHGGRIWCESAGVGKGSTFKVAWPLAAGPGPAAPALASQQPPP